MVDGKLFIFEIKRRSNYDDSDDHIHWHCVADDSPVSLHFVHHSKPYQHKQGGSSSDTVDPSRKRLQITGIDDGRPDDGHWQLSFPLLYQPLTQAFSVSVGVGELTDYFWSFGDKLVERYFL